MDEGDVALITTGIKNYFISKRRLRRGGINNNNKNKGKHKVTKKQNEKSYECGQQGYHMNECLMKKKS